MAETSTAIGTSILSSVLPPIVVKAASSALDQCEIYFYINREIEYRRSTLNELNEILEEAEKRQIDNNNIRDVRCEARNLQDHIITNRTTSRPVMFGCFPISFCPCFGNNESSSGSNLPFLSRLQLAKDIKSDRNKLDELMKQIDIANIRESLRKGSSKSESPSRRPEISCFENRQRNLFVGRKKKKEQIIKKLVHHNGNVLVVPICGIGGVGKTTLALSIYNDRRVKEEDYPICNRKWLSVGEKKFNAKEIIAKIIGESNTPGGKLVEYFMGNKFLIVLEDVWVLDSDEWNFLYNPLTHVSKGGVIIITTRNREVISATNTIVQNDLRPLSYKNCLKIFRNHAFVDRKSSDKKRSQKRSIGKEIVKKLDGLPLAAQVFGSLLLNAADETWSNFLETWEQNLRNNENKIMAVLRWSYDFLPSHLKHCFAYCALFPKGHVLDEKELVEMWMAHDLIQNVSGRPENIGVQYLNKLVDASLIRCVDKRYMINDMIHDLALFVSNEEFSSAIGSLSTPRMEKVRHITIIIDNEYSKNLSLCKSNRILTVYTPYKWYGTSTAPLEKDILLEVFKQSKNLRVLVLSNKHISEIPECIIELKHLRYLDVKKTSVKSLPNSLCQLHNLQMLAAPLDAVLPRDIVNIRSLRYVRANLPTCRGIKKLTSLQELSSIHVCEGDYIRELGDMQELRGKLIIKGLENVISSDDTGALMENQTLIDELELVFNQHFAESTISEEVLDALRCPPNLECLKIVGYTGVKSPSWMVYGKLGNLRIEYCSKIKLLDFGWLPSLRRLFVSSCDELISIYGLVAVKSLKIIACKKLKSVRTNFRGLDSLEELKISKCPLLESIHEERSTSSSSTSSSSSPWSRLQDLHTDNEQIFRNICEQDLISNITNITISNSMLVECLGEIMKNSSHKLKSFESLIISDCNQLRSLPTGCLPHSLESLRIYHCEQLKSLPADDLPSSLGHFCIRGCPLLYERCKDESGLDWHKINHIRRKHIRP